jgi:hypothetical protein
MLHVDPNNLNLVEECLKAYKLLERKKDNAAVAAFKIARVDPLAHDFAVVVGALVAAATCSDADIEKFKLMGTAAIKGLLPNVFNAQSVVAAVTETTRLPPVIEPKEASGAVAADKTQEKAEAPAELVGGAPDLIVIVPQRLAPEDADAMKETGFVCNTDMRRKKDVVYIWQGRAVPERVEAIVARYGATINKVVLPLLLQGAQPAEDVAESADLLSVAPEQHLTSADTDATEISLVADTANSSQGDRVGADEAGGSAAFQ